MKNKTIFWLKAFMYLFQISTMIYGYFNNNFLLVFLTFITIMTFIVVELESLEVNKDE